MSSASSWPSPKSCTSAAPPSGCRSPSQASAKPSAASRRTWAVGSSIAPAARSGLTPAGEELQRTIAPIIEELQRALAHATNIAAGIGGPLRLGFTSTTDGPALSRLVEELQSRHPDCQVILHEVNSGDPYAALRSGDADVLVNWLAVDEPDLTTGPKISLHNRLLVVARSHRLASRTSVLLEDLANEQVALLPPPFPAALYDAILPPATPSGRPIARTKPVRSINEIASHVARGGIVHITMTGVPVFARDDAAMIPIQDLAPTPLGLIWSSGSENAKIRALAEVASAIGPYPAQRTPKTSVQ